MTAFYLNEIIINTIYRSNKASEFHLKFHLKNRLLLFHVVTYRKSTLQGMRIRQII